MTISEWPEHERPREKLLQRGPATLSDAELLAIFIRSGVPGKTAVDVARDLLPRLGGLRGLPAARRGETAFGELVQGTVNGPAVHPREVVKRALKHNAGAVILVHNPPSGVAEP